MTLTAAVTGFILLLLCVEGVQVQGFLKVRCTRSPGCSFKGSTVEVNCTISYPPDLINRVERVSWFTKDQNGEPVDLLTDPQYEGRVSVTSDSGRHTLVITDLRESDSTEYNFKVETKYPGGTYTGVGIVYLTVTDLWIKVYKNGQTNEPYLSCQSRCSPHESPKTYIWYKNGEEIQEETSDSYDLKDFSDKDNFSCAVKGHEDHPSPPFWIRDHNMWEITCFPSAVCAFKGSEVKLWCTYWHTPLRHSDESFDLDVLWFTEEQNGEPVPVHQDPQYEGRVLFSDNPGKLYLTITDLRESDSAVYRVRLKTNHTEDTGNATVSLSVKDPVLQVQVKERMSSDWVYLKCESSCPVSEQIYYIWYKNGEKIEAASLFWYQPEDFIAADSYTCARNGLYAPLICVFGSSCNRVTYTDRKICAPKGSSLNISCSYDSYENITSKFWFSPKLPDWWKNRSLAEDLSEDPQYADRVQVLETERGRSTLRIKELRESDSADYRFKFQTQSFEWKSRLPATTVSVTALQVQVRRISTNQSSTYADLCCLSSCSPAHHFSYTWIRNGGTDITGAETFTYKGWFSLEEEISCALKGHEQFLSPPVYAPKVPSVVLSSFGEILENSSVTLTCSSDANPEANYTWYKKNGDPDFQPLSTEAELVFSSIQSSDSGEYYCEAENQLGKRTSKLFMVDVKCESMLIINVVRLALIPVILVAVLLLHLWLRTKIALSSITEPNQPEETVELESHPDDIKPSALRDVPAVQTPDTEEQETPV